MKRKQGISLIVLVITIIVMIILAASVVLTLSNTGIISRASEAVEKTNIKEVEQLATITWADEFMAGKRGDALKDAVLEKLKDYTDKYTITVSDTGVTVENEGSSEPTSPYKLSGAWEFSYEMVVDIDVMQEINISCAGQQFTSMELYDGCIYYNNVHENGGDTEHAYNPNNTSLDMFPGWSNEKYVVVDFGETPQPVSEEFYNWIIANASQEYVVSFTIEGVKHSVPGYFTWDEWLHSGYNTRGYKAISTGPTGGQAYIYTFDDKPLVHATSNTKVLVPYQLIEDGDVVIVDPSSN